MNCPSSFMLPRTHLLPACKLALSATLLCLALLSQTAQAQNNSRPAALPGASATSSNSPALEASAIQSLFVMPTAPKEGKDPFFPRSLRPYNTRPMTTNNVITAPIIADFRLNGITGPPDHRLAIINFKTFDTGEDGDVNTNAGRMRIRCLEIGADSVVIQIGAERRMLRLREPLKTAGP